MDVGRDGSHLLVSCARSSQPPRTDGAMAFVVRRRLGTALTLLASYALMSGCAPLAVTQDSRNFDVVNDLGTSVAVGLCASDHCPGQHLERVGHLRPHEVGGQFTAPQDPAQIIVVELPHGVLRCLTIDYQDAVDAAGPIPLSKSVSC